MRRSSEDFPAFGQSRQRRVDDELQAQDDLQLVARQPGLGKARSLPGRRRETGVSASALSATRGDEPRIGDGQVGDEATLRVEDLRPDGNANLDRLAVGAVLPAAHAVTALARTENLHATERGEVTKRGIREHDDVAAAASVAAVRSAPGTYFSRRKLSPP